jgi:hypothetical protein
MCCWPENKDKVIHPANASGINIAQYHNGISEAEQRDWAVLPLRYGGKTYGDPQARGLREIVLAAFESVLLLSWSLGGLSPVDEAEEEGGSSAVWLEHQGLLEIFFGALQRRGLPQERKHPAWVLHEQLRLGRANERVHLDGRLSGLVLIRCFEGSIRCGQEAFARNALCLQARLR